MENYYYIYAGHNADFGFIKRAFKSIVTEIKTALSKNVSVIVLSNSSEWLSDNIRKMQRIADYFVDHPIKFITFTGSIDGQEKYDVMFEKFGWKNKIEVKYTPIFEVNAAEQLLHMPEVSYEIINKKKLFLSFNRVAKLYRFNLLYDSIKYNLFNKSFFSFEGACIENLLNDNKFRNKQYDNLNDVLGMLPIRLNITETRTNPTNIIEDDIQYFSESYFSVVTETMFDVNVETTGAYKFFSEKVFKPISLKHPFIIAGWPTALIELRKLGYKTFSPFINEEYDTITDSEERHNAIMKELLRLSTMPDEYWLLWQKNIKEIVEYNYRTLKSKNRCDI
jgi:hypothetical protein